MTTQKHTLLDIRPSHQPSITRRRSNEHSRRIFKTPPIRNRLQPLLRAHNMRRVATLRGTKHLITSLELGRLAARKGRRRL